MLLLPLLSPKLAISRGSHLKCDAADPPDVVAAAVAAKSSLPLPTRVAGGERLLAVVVVLFPAASAAAGATVAAVRVAAAVADVVHLTLVAVSRGHRCLGDWTQPGRSRSRVHGARRRRSVFRALQRQLKFARWRHEPSRRGHASRQ